MEEKLTDQEQARQAKLPKYEALGVDPFGSRYDWTDRICDIRKKVEGKTAEDLENSPIEVDVAGRLMAIRMMGKASFVNLKDEFGQIQAWIGLNVIGEHDYSVFKLADLGDIVGLKGTLMFSKTGELTIRVEKYTHISKCLKPLPEKYHGLTDTEDRYRKRYLDLIVNDEARRIAILRPNIVKAIRNYCDSLGFIEVETPVLSPILGGAAARPFITHHNALDRDFYLRIATELNLKKCMVGGIDRVYEIGRIFRNEGIDIKHNPEFTTIELYQAYGDLQSMRDWMQGMVRYVCEHVMGTYELEWNGTKFDFSKPFGWVSMTDAIKEKCGVDFTKEYTFEEAVELAKKHNVPLEPSWNSVGYIIQGFFDELVEPTLLQPTFIHTYPIEVSPLTKKSPDPRFVERFELFVNGSELSNAYSEINNPIDQKERFLAQLAARERGDDEANEMDYSFLDALSYGMPPAGGIGVGIDRLVMMFANAPTIREVLLFPTLKTLGEKESKTKTSPAPETPVSKPDFSKVKIEPLFTEMVDFETFSKSDFRAVKVKECVAVDKSKKLLKFTLDDGSGNDRVILSGIHEYYEPEELVGKTCIAIVNLPPRRMMGIDSCGMLISAVHEEDGHEGLHLLMVDEAIPAGAKLY